ncbi:MAG: hypothetical protein EXS35_04845 [Pedosphaera sp.]|nr:hypothetical protein [Pedosphaera sp.]
MQLILAPHSTAYGWLMLVGIFVSITLWSRVVAAGILACRIAVASSPAEKTSVNMMRQEVCVPVAMSGANPGGKDARPLHQARCLTLRSC